MHTSVPSRAPHSAAVQAVPEPRSHPPNTIRLSVWLVVLQVFNILHFEQL